MPDPAARQAVAAVWRIESARIVGALARYAGDFALAEDVAQEALAQALVTWPRDGVPGNPAGWLLAVGRRRAIDAFRRRSALDERYAALARDLGEGGVAAGGSPVDDGTGGQDMLWDPDRIDDDMLARMFISCHPVLSREARVALTLRVAGGLTSDEIAKAFLVPTATVQPLGLRRDPPGARRLGPRGAGRGLGAHGLQAAIAECHAVAPSVDETGWPRIVAIYDGLRRLAPSPVAELNRAVAISMARGPGAALPIVDELVAAGALPGSHLLPSVRGELLSRLGRVTEARAELAAALPLCGNERERSALQRKLADLG